MIGLWKSEEKTARGFTYGFRWFRGVYGCEIKCDGKSDDEIWELALQLLGIYRDGRSLVFLKEEPDRERRARDRFFAYEFMGIAPGQFDILFRHSVFSGKKITVFCDSSLWVAIEQILIG